MDSPSTSTAILAGAGSSHTGNIRQANEDALLVRNDRGLWAVADGMGGHSAGAMASQLVVARLQKAAALDDPCDQMEAIEDQLLRANLDLRREATQRGVDVIGSTVVLAFIRLPYLYCGWVGDSRLYDLQAVGLVQCSRDHSDVEEMLQDARIDLAEYARRRGDAMITRAVGGADELYVDWSVLPVRPDSRIVLCSDGLTKDLAEAEIAGVLREAGSPESAAQALVNLALERSGRDNITAVVVFADGGVE